jgi:tetratricopeptide (TPR) repeat protein
VRFFSSLVLLAVALLITFDAPGQLRTDDFVVWDVTTGKTTPAKSAIPAIGDFAWSADGKTVAIGTQRDITVRREGRTESTRSLTNADGTITAIALSSTGAQLAVATSSGVVFVWSGQTTPPSKLTLSPSFITSLAFSADDSLLASGGTAVNVWNTKSWQIARAGFSAQSWVTALAFNPKTGDLATADFDGTVQILDAGGKVDNTYIAAAGAVMALSYSQSGSLLATAGTDGLVKVWRRREDPPMAVLAQNSPIRSICFSPNEAILAVSSDDRSVSTWNISSARILRTLTLENGYGRRMNFADDHQLEIGIQSSAPQHLRSLFILAVAGRAEDNDQSQAARGKVVSFADAVEARGRGNFGRIERKVLLDPEANLESVRSAVERWMLLMQPQDEFVLFYSGGVEQTERAPGLRFSAGKALSTEQLGHWLEAFPARNQFVVLDADHADEMQDELRRLLKPDQRSKDLDKRERLFIARKGPDSGPQAGQDSFASAVVDGLKGQADEAPKDDRVTASELQSYLYRRLLPSSGGQSRAAIDLDGDDFVLTETAQANRSVLRGSQVVDTSAAANSEVVFQKHRDYALLIATDNYDAWPQLSNPIQDAQAIADTLRDTYGFQVELLKNPKQLEIYQALARYNQKDYQAGDQLLVFVAGHGDFDRDAGEGFIVASDSKLPKDDPARGTFIPHARLRNYIDNLKVKHVLVVMDVCFGGTFDRKLSEAGARGGMYEKLPIEELFLQRDKWPTRKFITSGGETYVPDGEPGHHSPFVKNFLEEIRNPSGSPSYLTFADLLASVGSTNPVPVWGTWGQDEAGSDFFLISKSAMAHTSTVANLSSANSESIGQVVVHQRRSVCVLGLKNLSPNLEDANLGAVISDQLSGELGAGRKLLVVPSQTVSNTKLSLGLQEAESYSADTLLRVHQNTGADVVVGGSIWAPKGGGGLIRVSFTIQDAVTGETIDSSPVTGTEAGLGDLIGRAGALLRSKLGVSDISAQQVAEIKAGMPTTVDALKLYTAAIDRLHNYDASGARDLFIKADTAEPGVAFVHVGLADAWEYLGYDTNSIEEAKKAADLSTGFPKEVEYAIQARASELNGQWPRAIRDYAFLQMSNPDELEYTLQLAHAESDGGRATDALTNLEEAQNLPAPRGSDPRIMFERAYAQEQLGAFPEEKSAALQAIESAHRTGARLIEANANLRLCWAESNMGEADRAVEACETAASIYTSVGDKLGIARAKTGLGNALSVRPDYSGALEKYQEAAELTSSIGARGDHAGALLNVARIQTELGKLEEAEQSLNECVAVAKAIGDSSTEGKAYVNLAGVAQIKGNPQQAQMLMDEALRIAEAARDQDGMSRAYSNSATYQLDAGDLRAALASSDHCIEVRTKIANLSGIAYCQLTRGDILMAQGNLDQSRVAYETAEQLYQQAQSAGDLAVAWNSIAYLDLQSGSPADAEGLARKARLEFQKEKDSQMEAASLTVLVESLTAQGRKDEAYRTLQELILIHPDDTDQQLHVAVAEAKYLALAGNIEKALETLRIAEGQSQKAGKVNRELEIRLETLRIRWRAGENDGLESGIQALVTEASQRGFGLIAKQSAELHPTASRQTN